MAGITENLGMSSTLLVVEDAIRVKTKRKDGLEVNELC
jgi:hypothetical protein